MTSENSSTTTNLLEMEAIVDVDRPDDVSDTTTDTSVRTPPDMVPVAGNNRLSRFIMTVFPPDTAAKWLLPGTYFNRSIVNVWCGQFEECPQTERLHAHLYVEFKNEHRLRFNTVRQIIQDATGKPGDIAIAKKPSNRQRQCAVNYVLKPGERFFDTEPYIWQHNKVRVGYLRSVAKAGSKRKSREDVTSEIVDYIESKPIHWSWNQIVHESKESKVLLASCSWGAKYHSGRHEQNPRRTIREVIILYGAGGTGKTTMAQAWDERENEHKMQRYYRRNADDGKFWGGGRTAYQGQRIIHLEEFCGQETAANFKEICDIGKHGPSVNIKNSGTDLNHEIIIITSNHHPAAWYRKLFTQDEKQWVPIARRFTKVWFFPELRPDGTTNSPDDDHEPFYLDQTEEFKNMIYSYEDCKLHASRHWPLPIEQEGFGF